MTQKKYFTTTSKPATEFLDDPRDHTKNVTYFHDIGWAAYCSENLHGSHKTKRMIEN